MSDDGLRYYAGTVKIETERLILREFEIDDWQAVLAYQRDHRYQQFYSFSERTETEAQDFVQKFLSQQSESPRRKYQLAVTIAGTDEVIGTCGIRRKAENDKEADIGFELAPWHWGNGFATEAAQSIVQFGFDELELHKISSKCIAENIASARVLENVGLRREGKLRDDEFFKNRWWDTLLFGILEEEWNGSTVRA